MSNTANSDFGAAGAACGSAGLSGLAAALGLCCYGPMAVTLIGVTGAAWFSSFEPYRPIVLVAAGALLAWSFWRVYRTSGRGLGIQVVLWSSLVALIASLVLPDIAARVIHVGPPGS